MDSPPDWITTPIEAGLVRGAVELEPTEHGLQPHRLPAWARRQIPDGQLAMAEAQPAGVRRGLPDPGHRRRAGRAPDQDGLRGRSASSRRRLRPARRRPPDRPRDGLRRQRPDRRHDHRVHGHRARTGRHGPVHRPARRREACRDLGDVPGGHRAGGAAHGRPGRARARPWSPGVAAPRQLDQPGLRRREPDDDLAGAGRGPRWCRAGQPRLRRQRPAGPVHRPHACATSPPTWSASSSASTW